MLLLGIETSTPASSVALGTEHGVVASAAVGGGLERLGRVHGSFVASAVAFCLERAGLDASDINGVTVSLGPGLFTGMRVGIATAQAFAHARRLPVVGFPSLDLLAFPVRHVRRAICPVIDARRGELFYAWYRSAPGGIQRVTEFRCGPAEKLAGEIEATGEEVLCVGDGAIAHRSLLESAGAEVGSEGSAHPTAQALVELSVPRFIREETQRPEELHPVYVRQADARINWQHRGALAGGKPRGPSPGDVEAGA